MYIKVNNITDYISTDLQKMIPFFAQWNAIIELSLLFLFSLLYIWFIKHFYFTKNIVTCRFNNTKVIQLYSVVHL